MQELSPEKIAQVEDELAGSEYEAGTVLVELPSGASADELNAQLNALGYLDAGITAQDVSLGYAEVSLAPGVDVAQALAALDENTLVEAAQPNFIYHVLDDLPAAAEDGTSSSEGKGGVSATDGSGKADGEGSARDASRGAAGDEPGSSASDGSLSGPAAGQGAGSPDSGTVAGSSDDPAGSDTTIATGAADAADAADVAAAADPDGSDDAADDDAEAADDSGEVDDLKTAQATSINDPYPNSSADNKNQWALASVHAYEAWDLQKGEDADIAVAVIDSGCNVTHEDLAANIVSDSSYNVLTGGSDVADDMSNTHGTHVSGIIAGVTNNGKGISGVTYNAKIVPVKAIDSEGSASSRNIRTAFNYVIAYAKRYNVKVINVSIGGSQSTVSGTTTSKRNDRLFMQAIKSANDAGILVVCAAGNTSSSTRAPYACFPCDYVDSLVGVINVTQSSTTSSSSNYNQGKQATKSISGPGNAIYSTLGGSDTAYGKLSGTSMATPYVSGIAALVMAKNPDLTPAQVSSILYSTTTDINASGFDAETGFGLVNAYAALQSAQKASYLDSSAGLSVLKGQTITLTPSAGAGGGASSYAWTSSDTSVATVSGGTLTGVSAGSVGVTATKGNVHLSQKIMVYDASVSSGPSTARYGTFQDYTLSSAPSGSWSWSTSNSLLANIWSASDTSCTVRFGGYGYYDDKNGVDLVATLDTNPNVKVVYNVKVVKPNDISAATVTWPNGNEFTYTGSALTPEPTVTLDGYTLVKDTDYTLSWSNNTNAGTATVTVTGAGAFDSSKSKTSTFAIKKAMSQASIAAIPTQIYNGWAIQPTPTVTWGGTTLKKDADYTLSWSNNTNVGTATVTVTGKGNYTGTRSATFAIKRLSYSGPSSMPAGGVAELSCPGFTLKVEGGSSYGAIVGSTYTAPAVTSSRTATIGIYDGSMRVASRTIEVHPIVSGAYFVRSAVNAGYVLDISGGSTANGGNVQLYSNNGSLAQKYTFTLNSDGYYTITNAKDGKVLDVSGGSTANGANVQQWTSNGSNAQRWLVRVDASNQLTFERKGASGRVLDVAGGRAANGRNVQQYASNGTAAQKWTLAATSVDSGHTAYEGTFRLASGANTGFVLDVSGGSKANGGNVQVWRSNGSSAQKWTLTYLGSGLYRMTNVGSGRVLDVSGGSKANGVNVQQWAWNGTAAQKWRLQANADGTYTLANSGSGRALDVSGGKAANGRNVQQWNSNGTNAQRWRLYQY